MEIVGAKVNKEGDAYRVALTDGRIVSVAVAPGQELYEALLTWIADGGEVEPAYTLAAAKADALTRNEDRTTSTILKIMPAHRQRNYIARMIELQDHKMEGTFEGEMIIEYESMRGMWDFVKGERHRCQQAEKAIGECNTIEELEALGI